MLTARNVAPRGFPRLLNVLSTPALFDKEVLRRKSCVMAIPMDAKASDVRSHARNVRSESGQYLGMGASSFDSMWATQDIPT